MGRYSAIPPKFQTDHEKEHDRAYTDAMSAMRDPRSDETQMLGESMTDHMHDLLDLAALAVASDDDCYIGTRFKNFVRTLANGIANDEARKAAEQIPSDEFETYGIARGSL